MSTLAYIFAAVLFLCFVVDVVATWRIGRDAFTSGGWAGG